MLRRDFLLAGTAAASGGMLPGRRAFAQGRPAPLDRVLAQLRESKARVTGCRLSNSRISTSPPEPETVVDLRNQGHSDQAMRMSAFVIVNSSRWHFGNDGAAGKRAVLALASWAAADAHAKVLTRHLRGSSSRWPTYGLVTAVLNSLFLLHGHPDLTAERRSLVFDWLDRTFRRSWLHGQLPRDGAGYRDREQRVNNHNARRSLAQLYMGIHRGDGRLIRTSSENLQRSVSAIDRSGVPYDANRGDWALRYVNLALDSMVMHQTFLWLADPSALKRRNVERLDMAGAFLFEETARQERIHAYASANIGRPQGSYGGRQDMDWLSSRDGGFVWWAYVDAPVFRRAMPNARAAAMKALEGSPHWDRTKYSDTGGAVGCWFAA